MVLEEDELLVALVVGAFSGGPGPNNGEWSCSRHYGGNTYWMFQNHQLNRMESLRLRSLPLQRVTFPAMALRTFNMSSFF